MTTKIRHPLALAEVAADSLVRQLEDSCQKITVAGSIRRRRSDVGDIELLCVPKPSGLDLFGRQVLGDNQLDRRCRELIEAGILGYRPNRVGAVTFGPQNKLLVHRPTGIPVDVFSTEASNWGMALVVRTGPAGFNTWMMKRFRQLQMLGHAYGGVSRDGEELPCPTEELVFELMEWPWVRPEDRRDFNKVERL